MAEIKAKSIAGALMILLPVVFWLSMYLRFDCGGGHCSLGMEWLLVGFALIVFGTVLLLSTRQKTEEEDIPSLPPKIEAKVIRPPQPPSEEGDEEIAPKVKPNGSKKNKVQ